MLDFDGKTFGSSYLRVAPSLISNAGHGCFVRKSYMMGELIDYYYGEYSDKDTPYNLNHVDASKEPRCRMAYANDPIGTLHRPNVYAHGDTENLIFSKCIPKHIGRRAIKMYAGEDISSGEELYFPYGAQYWFQRYYSNDFLDVTDEMINNTWKMYLSFGKIDCTGKGDLFLKRVAMFGYAQECLLMTGLFIYWKYRPTWAYGIDKNISIRTLGIMGLLINGYNPYISLHDEFYPYIPKEPLEYPEIPIELKQLYKSYLG